MNEMSYPDRLGDELEIILGEGAEELDMIVARLNTSELRPAGGENWTPDSLVAELKRLGQ